MSPNESRPHPAVPRDSSDRVLGMSGACATPTAGSNCASSEQISIFLEILEIEISVPDLTSESGSENGNFRISKKF